MLLKVSDSLYLSNPGLPSSQNPPLPLRRGGKRLLPQEKRETFRIVEQRHDSSNLPPYILKDESQRVYDSKKANVLPFLSSSSASLFEKGDKGKKELTSEITNQRKKEETTNKFLFLELKHSPSFLQKQSKKSSQNLFNGKVHQKTTTLIEKERVFDPPVEQIHCALPKKEEVFLTNLVKRFVKTPYEERITRKLPSAHLFETSPLQLKQITAPFYLSSVIVSTFALEIRKISRPLLFQKGFEMRTILKAKARVTGCLFFPLFLRCPPPSLQYGGKNVRNGGKTGCNWNNYTKLRRSFKGGKIGFLGFPSYLKKKGKNEKRAKMAFLWVRDRREKIGKGYVNLKEIQGETTKKSQPFVILPEKGASATGFDKSRTFFLNIAKKKVQTKENSLRNKIRMPHRKPFFSCWLLPFVGLLTLIPDAKFSNFSADFKFNTLVSNLTRDRKSKKTNITLHQSESQFLLPPTSVMTPFPFFEKQSPFFSRYDWNNHTKPGGVSSNQENIPGEHQKSSAALSNRTWSFGPQERKAGENGVPNDGIWGSGFLNPEHVPFFTQLFKLRKEERKTFVLQSNVRNIKKPVFPRKIAPFVKAQFPFLIPSPITKKEPKLNFPTLSYPKAYLLLENMMKKQTNDFIPAFNSEENQGAFLFKQTKKKRKERPLKENSLRSLKNAGLRNCSNFSFFPFLTFSRNWNSFEAPYLRGGVKTGVGEKTEKADPKSPYFLWKKLQRLNVSIKKPKVLLPFLTLEAQLLNIVSLKKPRASTLPLSFYKKQREKKEKTLLGFVKVEQSQYNLKASLSRFSEKRMPRFLKPLSFWTRQAKASLLSSFLPYHLFQSRATLRVSQKGGRRKIEWNKSIQVQSTKAKHSIYLQSLLNRLTLFRNLIAFSPLNNTKHQKENQISNRGVPFQPKESLRIPHHPNSVLAFPIETLPVSHDWNQSQGKPNGPLDIFDVLPTEVPSVIVPIAEALQNRNDFDSNSFKLFKKANKKKEVTKEGFNFVPSFKDTKSHDTLIKEIFSLKNLLDQIFISTCLKKKQIKERSLGATLGYLRSSRELQRDFKRTSQGKAVSRHYSPLYVSLPLSVFHPIPVFCQKTGPGEKCKKGGKNVSMEEKRKSGLRNCSNFEKTGMGKKRKSGGKTDRGEKLEIGTISLNPYFGTKLKVLQSNQKTKFETFRNLAITKKNTFQSFQKMKTGDFLEKRNKIQKHKKQEIKNNKKMIADSYISWLQNELNFVYSSKDPFNLTGHFALKEQNKLDTLLKKKRSFVELNLFEKVTWNNFEPFSLPFGEKEKKSPGKIIKMQHPILISGFNKIEKTKKPFSRLSSFDLRRGFEIGTILRKREKRLPFFPTLKEREKQSPFHLRTSLLEGPFLQKEKEKQHLKSNVFLYSFINLKNSFHASSLKEKGEKNSRQIFKLFAIGGNKKEEAEKLNNSQWLCRLYKQHFPKRLFMASSLSDSSIFKPSALRKQTLNLIHANQDAIDLTSIKRVKGALFPITQRRWDSKGFAKKKKRGERNDLTTKWIIDKGWFFERKYKRNKLRNQRVRIKKDKIQIRLDKLFRCFLFPSPFGKEFLTKSFGKTFPFSPQSHVFSKLEQFRENVRSGEKRVGGKNGEKATLKAHLPKLKKQPRSFLLDIGFADKKQQLNKLRNLFSVPNTLDTSLSKKKRNSRFSSSFLNRSGFSPFLFKTSLGFRRLFPSRSRGENVKKGRKETKSTENFQFIKKIIKSKSERQTTHNSRETNLLFQNRFYLHKMEKIDPVFSPFSPGLSCFSSFSLNGGEKQLLLKKKDKSKETFFSFVPTTLKREISKKKAEEEMDTMKGFQKEKRGTKQSLYNLTKNVIKHSKKKRRVLKQKRETGRLLKRKRFDPRPSWLRGTMHKKFLRYRHRKGLSHSVVLWPLLPPIETPFNKLPGFQKKEEKRDNRKKSGEKEIDLPLTAEKEFYNISQSVFNEFQQGLWKSSWLRLNLNSYLRKIKTSFHLLKETSKTSELRYLTKKVLLENFGLAALPSLFFPPSGFVRSKQSQKRKAFFPSTQEKENKKMEKKEVKKVRQKNNQADLSLTLKWNTILKTAEYNKITYDRIQQIIINMKHSLGTGLPNSTPKTKNRPFNNAHHKLKKEGSFLTANSSSFFGGNSNQDPSLDSGSPFSFNLFSFANSIIQTPGAFKNRVHSILKEQPYFTIHTFDNMSQKKIYWALNKSHMWHYKNVNKKEFLWANQKYREQTRANKTKKILNKIMTCLSLPLQEVYPLYFAQALNQEHKDQKETGSSSLFQKKGEKGQEKREVTLLDVNKWKNQNQNSLKTFLKKQEQKEIKMGELGFLDSNGGQSNLLLMKDLFSNGFKESFHPNLVLFSSFYPLSIKIEKVEVEVVSPIPFEIGTITEEGNTSKEEPKIRENNNSLPISQKRKESQEASPQDKKLPLFFKEHKLFLRNLKNTLRVCSQEVYDLNFNKNVQKATFKRGGLDSGALLNSLIWALPKNDPEIGTSARVTKSLSFYPKGEGFNGALKSKSYVKHNFLTVPVLRGTPNHFSNFTLRPASRAVDTFLKPLPQKKKIGSFYAPLVERLVYLKQSNLLKTQARRKILNSIKKNNNQSLHNVYTTRFQKPFVAVGDRYSSNAFSIQKRPAFSHNSFSLSRKKEEEHRRYSTPFFRKVFVEPNSSQPEVKAFLNLNPGQHNNKFYMSQTAFLLGTIIFHLCSLFSLISISQIRCVIKFLILATIKLSLFAKVFHFAKLTFLFDGAFDLGLPLSFGFSSLPSVSPLSSGFFSSKLEQFRKPIFRFFPHPFFPTPVSPLLLRFPPPLLRFSSPYFRFSPLLLSMGRKNVREGASKLFQFRENGSMGLRNCSNVLFFPFLTFPPPPLKYEGKNGCGKKQKTGMGEKRKKEKKRKTPSGFMRLFQSRRRGHKEEKTIKYSLAAPLAIKRRKKLESEYHTETLSFSTAKIRNLGRLNTLLKFGSKKFGFIYHTSVSKLADLRNTGTRNAAIFFGKPGESISVWINHLFLIEMASDLTTTIPGNTDSSVWTSFAKFAKSLSTTPVLGTLLEKRLLNSVEYFFEKVSQPDTDLIVRQRKGEIFLDVWVPKSPFAPSSLEELKKINPQKIFSTQVLEIDKQPPGHCFKEQSRRKLFTQSTKEERKQTGNSTAQRIRKRWSANQFITFKGKDTDLLIHSPPAPKSFASLYPSSFLKQSQNPRISFGLKEERKPKIGTISKDDTKKSRKEQEAGLNRSAQLIKAGKHYNFHSEGIAPLGTMICQIYSGLFWKETAKSCLVVGISSKNSHYDEKSLLIQSLAGETEMKIIRDNANRYNFALGIRSLRNVFEALALHTPCIFLIEDIHVIGERRPLLVGDDENAKAAEQSQSSGDQKESPDERNLSVAKLTRHSVMHYRKPFRGDFSFLIPANNYSFDLFLGSRFGAESESEENEPMNQKPSNSESQTGFSESLKRETLSASKLQANLPSSLSLSHSDNPLAMGAEIKGQTTVLTPKNSSYDLPWIGKFNEAVFSQQSTFPIVGLFPSTESSNVLSTEGMEPGGQNPVSAVLKIKNSIRVKIALLANLAVSNLSVKLNMITDLLVIIDSVRSNRGFVVFATTHLPSTLDPALRRPGRLEETIALPFIPKLESRWEIVKSNLAQFAPSNSSGTSDSLFFKTSFPPLFLIGTNNRKASLNRNPKFDQHSEVLLGDTLFEMETISRNPQRRFQGETIFDVSPLSSSFGGNGEKKERLSSFPLKLFKHHETQRGFKEEREKNTAAIPDSGFPMGLTVDLLDYGLFNLSLATFNLKTVKIQDRFTLFKQNQMETISKGGTKIKRLKRKKREKTRKLNRINETFILDNILEPSNFSVFKPEALTKRSSFLSPFFSSKKKGKSEKKKAFVFLPERQRNKNSENKGNLIAIAYSKIGKLLINNKFANSAEPNLSLFITLHSEVEVKKNEINTNGKIQILEPYIPLYSKQSLVKQYLMGLFAPKVAETFAFSGKKKMFGPSEVSKLSSIVLLDDKEKEGKPRKTIPFCGMQNLQGIDKTWGAATSLILTVIEKRLILKKNVIIPKLLQFYNAAAQKSSLQSSPSPPASFLLLPAKRYENYKNTFFAMQKSLKNSLLSLPFSFSPPNLRVSRMLEKEGKNASKNRLSPSLHKKNAKETSTKKTKVSWKEEEFFDKPTVFNNYFRNKILNRHRGYLNNQWWNGQLAEQSVETSFLSDIDWRSNFVSSLKSKKKNKRNISFPGLTSFDRSFSNSPATLGQKIKPPLDFSLLVEFLGQRREKRKKIRDQEILAKLKTSKDFYIDFPDFDQHYNPGNRRWVLHFGYWSYWSNFKTAHNSEIYSFIVTESFLTTFNFLNSNREILDYLVTKIIKFGLLKEITIVDGFKRF